MQKIFSWRLLILSFALPLGLAGCVSQAHVSELRPAPKPQVTIRVSGSGTGLPLVAKIAEAYQKQRPEVAVQILSGTDSGGAISGVMDGTLEIAVANRPLKDTEAADPIVYRAFAQDLLVFAVRLPNELKNITTGQVRDIYGGKTTNWKQLGGMDSPSSSSIGTRTNRPASWVCCP